MATRADIAAGRAHVELYLKNSKFLSALARTGAAIQGFGMRAFGGALPGPMMAILERFASPAGIVAGMGLAVKMWAAYGEALDEAAARAGMAVEAFGGLRFAAEQSGATGEDLEVGLRRMAKMLSEAAHGSKGPRELLRQLGLDMRGLANLSMDEQFLAIADAIDKIPNPTDRAAVAMSVFGRSGTKLLPMIQGGAKALRGFMQNAKDLGLIVNAQAAAAAGRLNDKFHVLAMVSTSAARAIGGALAPVTEVYTDKAILAMKGLREWIENNERLVRQIFGVNSALVALGASLAVFGKALQFLRPLALLLTRIGGPIIASLLSGFFALAGMLVTMLSSPLGLVIAAVALLSGSFMKLGQVAKGVVGFLGFYLGNLWRWAKAAAGGIVDALAGGDLALAAKILGKAFAYAWATIQVAARDAWENIKEWGVGVALDIAESFLGLFPWVWAAIKKDFYQFMVDIELTATKVINSILQSLPQFMRPGTVGRTQRQMELERNRRQAAADTQMNRQLQDLAKWRGQKQQDILFGVAGKPGILNHQAWLDAQRAQADAARELQAAINEAAALKKGQVPGLPKGGLLGALGGGAGRIGGTFSGWAAAAMQFGGPLADPQRQTARNTQAMLRQMQEDARWWRALNRKLIAMGLPPIKFT